MLSCLDSFACVLSSWHSFHALCLRPFLQNALAMQTIRTYSSSKNLSFDWNLGCYSCQTCCPCPKSLVSNCLLVCATVGLKHGGASFSWSHAQDVSQRSGSLLCTCRESSCIISSKFIWSFFATSSWKKITLQNDVSWCKLCALLVNRSRMCTPVISWRWRSVLSC